MPKEFFDRTDEIRQLTERYEKSGEGEMIVVYGRRRVGKTELIKEFMKKVEERKKIYLYIDLAGRQELLDSFSRSIREQTGDTVKFGNFDDFFRFIGEKSEKTKFLLVIDEFQRFLDIAPDFITKLQDRWDSQLHLNKLMIILVGSSIGMIQRITESRAGALYGRVSKIKISPFRYVDFRTMFKELDETERVIRYAVFGGTPFYLSKTRGIQSTFQAVSELVLKKGGELYEEPKNLLEFENVRIHATYNSILNAIASGKEVMKEMQDATKIPSTTMPAYLGRMDSLLDLVGRRDPVLGKERLGRYAIRDNFFRFWYKFVFPNQTALNLGNEKLVSDAIRENLNSYVGRVFEDIVRELFILYQNRSMKGVEINFEDIGSWWDRNGNEIDLVVLNKNELILGEVKWTDRPMEASVLDDLMRKTAFIDYRGRIRYVLVAKNGFTEACKALAAKTNTTLLTLEDLTQLFDSATTRHVERA